MLMFDRNKLFDELIILYMYIGYANCVKENVDAAKQNS
jgi:hypothetical protein